MAIGVGIVIGSQSKPWAVCVAEGVLRQFRGVPGSGQVSRLPYEEGHYTVRMLERHPPGTQMPQFLDRLRELFDRLHELADRQASWIQVRVNVSRKGSTVAAHLQLILHHSVELRPVYFNFGDKYTKEASQVQLGKAFLVGRLQAFLQTARLHLPKDEQAKLLAEELAEYEVEMPTDASSREGAFQVGTRDELVTALGLAILEDPLDLELPIQFRAT